MVENCNIFRVFHNYGMYQCINNIMLVPMRHCVYYVLGATYFDKVHDDLRVWPAVLS